MSNKDEIAFLTFHNWETNRQGGFHKFAEAFAEHGHYVHFFSFPRAYYTYFKSKKSDERLNREVFKKLTKGVVYNVGSGVIENSTLPTFAPPGALYKFISKKVRYWLQKTSFKNTDMFFKKKFKNVKYFVFESNESLIFYNKIKKLFPKSKIIYRPSDPLCANKNISEYIIKAEKQILFNADFVFIVNTENLNTITSFYKEYKVATNYSILNNGVDLKAYTKKYAIPVILKKNNTVLYVGARDIEWDMVVEAAKMDSTINYFVITPEKPNTNFLDYTKNKSTNLFFINGIKPSEVPKYLTNANVVMVPNPKDRYIGKNWGITAKYLQAMAAKKPIVAYHDGDYLKKYAIEPVFTTKDFVEKIKEGLTQKEVNYNIDFNKRDWEFLKKEFYKKVLA